MVEGAGVVRVKSWLGATSDGSVSFVDAIGKNVIPSPDPNVSIVAFVIAVPVMVVAEVMSRIFFVPFPDGIAGESWNAVVIAAPAKERTLLA